MMKKEWNFFFLLNLIVFGLIALVAVVVPLLKIYRKPNVNLIYTKENPERIVSLAPNITEILYELGLGDKIVAVSSDSDYPVQAMEKKKTGTFWYPNSEAVIASKPDLTITLGFDQQRTVAQTLNRLGYNVLTLNIDTIKELFDAIQKIGTATGAEQRADQLINEMQNQLTSLKSKYNQENKIPVLWVMEADPVRAAGRNTFINELIECAGGVNAIGPTIQTYPPVSSEELMTCKAEVILQSAMVFKNIEKERHDAEIFWSKFPNLPAVKNKRIYVINADTTLRLGPRLLQGIETIANYIHQGNTVSDNN